MDDVASREGAYPGSPDVGVLMQTAPCTSTLVVSDPATRERLGALVVSVSPSGQAHVDCGDGRWSACEATPRGRRPQ